MYLNVREYFENKLFQLKPKKTKKKLFSKYSYILFKLKDKLKITMIKIFKLIFNILITFIVLLFLSNYSFANTGKTVEIKQENPKTIKQLKENIEVLKSKKVINFSMFEKFKIEHWGLQNYFSKELFETDFLEIEKIISDYKINKEKIKSTFKSSEKTQKLLDLEKKLYNSLTAYIDKDKITSYNIFVEKSLSTIKKEDEIETEIKDKKEKINEKLSTIKNKIKENNKVQQEKLNTLLKIKIKDKILKFKNSKKIKSLWVEKQKLLFKIVLKKILEKKEKTKELTQKQKNLYSIIEEVLREIIEEL